MFCHYCVQYFSKIAQILSVSQANIGISDIDIKLEIGHLVIFRASYTFYRFSSIKTRNGVLIASGAITAQGQTESIMKQKTTCMTVK